jgi:hypothetical protein
MNKPILAAPQAVNSGPSPLVLWSGLLIGPSAWALHMQLSYSLVLWVCKHGHGGILHMVSAFFLAMALGGVLLSTQCWQVANQQAGDAHIETAMARSRFMAALGIMANVLFALVIVAQGIASFMISPCQQ